MDRCLNVAQMLIASYTGFSYRAAIIFPCLRFRRLFHFEIELGIVRNIAGKTEARLREGDRI